MCSGTISPKPKTPAMTDACQAPLTEAVKKSIVGGIAEGLIVVTVGRFRTGRWRRCNSVYEGSTLYLREDSSRRLQGVCGYLRRTLISGSMWRIKLSGGSYVGLEFRRKSQGFSKASGSCSADDLSKRTGPVDRQKKISTRSHTVSRNQIHGFSSVKIYHPRESRTSVLHDTEV